MTDLQEQIKAVMIGHAVGDALGLPVEFCSREELKEEPVTDMQGYGTISSRRAHGRTIQVCLLQLLTVSPTVKSIGMP